MAQTRQVAMGPMLGAVLAGAALTGIVVWRFNLDSLDRAVNVKRSAVKKLVLSGGIPPTQEVMDYLTARQQALEARYQRWLDAITVPPPAEAVPADPQLYFQQQVHEVQRTLERLAAARSVPAPAQLGLPKELPPSDTVPRLLAQLQLVQQAAELAFEQDVSALASLKVEDPDPIPAEEGSETFLLALPVRVRFTGTLNQTIKVLGAMERVRPLIDIRSLRLVSAADPSQLEAELLIARYAVMPAIPKPASEEPRGSAKKKTSKRRGTTSSRAATRIQE
ncbi:MAG: hypothetical protein HY599_05950 [Candidatus Omnitrophica bacterium]|nr:hypothetical protein [Candidatus Omnitrophota bacterium]